VARVEHLSLGYLEQLMSALRRAGLVEATRGAGGGYRLACPPAAITVGEIYRVLERPIAPVECVDENYVAGSCDREAACASRSIWRRVQTSIAQVVDCTTLEDLCHEGCTGLDGGFISLDSVVGSRKAMCAKL
jgi:Rrf2 family transcriptional regulator, cysteine metabolism repressor